MNGKAAATGGGRWELDRVREIEGREIEGRDPKARSEDARENAATQGTMRYPGGEGPHAAS